MYLIEQASVSIQDNVLIVPEEEKTYEIIFRSVRNSLRRLILIKTYVFNLFRPRATERKHSVARARPDWKL